MDWNRPPNRGPGPGNYQDFEEFFNRLKNSFDFRSLMRGPGWLLVLLAIVIILAINSVYQVEAEETAVVQRFGEFDRTASSGLHWKLPFGIEKVTKVRTGRVFQQEYGYETTQAGVRSRFRDIEEQARMLSGDLNVVDLQWTVFYKVSDPVQYLFRVQDVEATLDDVSESVARRIVGNRYADEVLTVGRASIAGLAEQEIQRIMTEYNTGINIVSVKLQNANPPDPVKAAFNEVNEARQDKERMINEAQRNYNEVIPKAKGEARQMLTQAEGYALERINRSRGEADRFNSILGEYSKAPKITRRRMYLEAVGDLSSRVNRLIVMDKNAPGVLPLLDLGGMGKSARKGASGDKQDDAAIGGKLNDVLSSHMGEGGKQ